MLDSMFFQENAERASARFLFHLKHGIMITAITEAAASAPAVAPSATAAAATAAAVEFPAASNSTRITEETPVIVTNIRELCIYIEFKNIYETCWSNKYMYSSLEMISSSFKIYFGENN